MSDEVVGMMSMAGDRSQKEAALAELTRRDPEYRQQRIESARAGETVRRILGSGKPNAQALVNEYLGQLRQQQS
jgi:hypothetical protein